MEEKWKTTYKISKTLTGHMEDRNCFSKHKCFTVIIDYRMRVEKAGRD